MVPYLQVLFVFRQYLRFDSTCTLSENYICINYPVIRCLPEVQTNYYSVRVSAGVVVTRAHVELLSDQQQQQQPAVRCITQRFTFH